VTRFTFAALLALAVATPALAQDAYDDSQSHPLRVAAYVIHPVGWALEWMLARPLHFFVSQPGAEPVFGHEGHESPYGYYEPYRHPYFPERDDSLDSLDTP
jgi:hypothetical protein